MWQVTMRQSWFNRCRQGRSLKQTELRRYDTCLEDVLEELGAVDLAIISAGTGHNAVLNWRLDVDTVTVNVLGFMAMAQVAMRHFLERGRGHLVGISSVAALRVNRAAAYAASKAFQSVYLDGLRDLARQSGHPIVVTEVQPGGVDTAMLKPDRPLSSCRDPVRDRSSAPGGNLGGKAQARERCRHAVA